LRFPFALPLPGLRRPTPGRPAGPAGGRPRQQPALSRLDRERARERLTVFVLSAIVGLCVLLVGGALLWDRVIVPQRPVARVDGRPITLQAYTDALAYRENVLLAQYEQAQRLAFQPTPAAGSGGEADFMSQFAQQRLNAIQNQLAGLSTGLVDDLIDEQVVRAAAAQRGITATPAEIDAELKTLLGYQDPSLTPSPAPAGTPQAAPAAEGAEAPPPGATATPAPAAPAAARRPQDFQSIYREYRRATAGTDAVIRGDTEHQILRRKLEAQLAAEVAPQAEQVHARHILVADETTARVVLERLNNGESFESLAAELSTDTGSKDSGGDLGWFPRGFMVSAFEDAAFNLQAGQTSEPVKTSFGTHIIRVDERAPTRDLEPEQLQALKSNALPRWLETEREKHQIENLLTPEQQEWAARNVRRPQFSAR
jgi:parvulin-like peptidyl-prolyl isomerase